MSVSSSVLESKGNKRRCDRDASQRASLVDGGSQAARECLGLVELIPPTLPDLCTSKVRGSACQGLVELAPACQWLVELAPITLPELCKSKVRAKISPECDPIIPLVSSVVLSVDSLSF